MKIKALIIILFIIIKSALYSQIINVDSTTIIQKINCIPKGNNHKRYKYLKQLKDNELFNGFKVKTEAIDWIGIYKNIIYEKKGSSDSIIYVVSHYDKIDGNIFSTFNLLFNGTFDIFFSNFYLSDGIYDNGTGVISSLMLMEWLNSIDSHYTYKFLFTGMEEFGLRGVRTHISRIKKEEWNKVKCAINIDMIGGIYSNKISVTKNVSDSSLLKIAYKVAEKNHISYKDNFLPSGALADFYLFKGQNFFKDFGISLMGNVTGAFIPQRSYFTGIKKTVPVINFSDDIKFGFSEYSSTLSPVSFGKIHSFKDSPKIISINNLIEYQKFFREFILAIDLKSY